MPRIASIRFWAWAGDSAILPLAAAIATAARFRRQALISHIGAPVYGRGLVWINVTQNPTAEWIAHQLTEAFSGSAKLFTIRFRFLVHTAAAIGVNATSDSRASRAF